MMHQQLPSEREIDSLCVKLASLATLRGESIHDWPSESLQHCGAAGVYFGLSPGSVWSEADGIRCYLRLATADLTTTFIITQYMGACRRIQGSSNEVAKAKWLQQLLQGEQFATVGISHLTTSRRHLGTPVLKASPAVGSTSGAPFVLNGYSPWVTGGAHADVLVVGATLEDGREILVAVPRDRQGIKPSPGLPLVALSASCTDRVDFEQVEVFAEEVLAGPCVDVMSTGVGAGTGGLQTSTLAVGLSFAATAFLHREAEQRTDLKPIAMELQRQCNELEQLLLSLVAGTAACSTADLRTQANSLVLRASQAALGAAKGAGYVAGHPAGRWCREALFFMVWSCPQPVMQAHLCELAGLA